MTKLGLLTAAALIALSPLAMAQSSDPVISHGGSYVLAQAQGESQSEDEMTSPSQEQTASPTEDPEGSQDQNSDPSQDEKE